MIIQPRFKASFDVHTVDDQVLFLQDEHRSAILDGPIYAHIAKLVDGHRTSSEIVVTLQDKFPIQNIFFAMNILERRSYLVESENAPANDESAFLEYLYQRSGEEGELPPGTSRIVNSTVSLESVGNLRSDILAAALGENDLEVAENGDLRIVITDDYLRPELEQINLQQQTSGKPWLLIKPVGMVLWIGPLMVPGETGCWSCLAHRLAANRQIETFIQEQGPRPDELVISTVARTANSESLAANLAATEVLKWLTNPTSSLLHGVLRTYDIADHKFASHTLCRRPQCRTCGDPEWQLNANVPIALSSHRIKYSEDGGHRTLTPAETYSAFKHHVSPILGAVTELIPAYGSQGGLTHSYVAGHNFSMGIDSLVFLQESLRGMSGGKGSTDIQARVSGLCEALERYSGLFWGEEFVKRGSYVELQPDAIHPNACMGFSEEQFNMRKSWNESQLNSRCHLITDPFDETLETDWSPLWSLTHNRQRYLPTAYCYYGHPDFKTAKWCSPDSNGSAAGNCLEEAIFQGAMELIERDAVAVWWYNRLQQPGVDITSFHMPYVDALVDYYASINRDIWVLDLTHDLGVCTLACISRRNDQETEDIILGFGTHFDPKIALLRAMTEVNQFLPSVSLKNNDGTTRYLFGDELAKQWWGTAQIGTLDYLTPSEHQAKTFSDFDNPSTQDVLTDVEHLVGVFRDNDMEMLVLDQTRPDIGLNVVKVVVPELCHFWRRFGKRRLYELPVQLGLLPEPKTADDLNPHSIFF
jgi:oxazoline/thiazoline synthase